MLLNEMSEILHTSVSKDPLCHPEGLTRKCFCPVFSPTKVMKVKVNTGPRVGWPGGGGRGYKKGLSVSAFRLAAKNVQAPETPPGGVGDRRGNSCFALLGTKEVSGRKEYRKLLQRLLLPPVSVLTVPPCTRPVGPSLHVP